MSTTRRQDPDTWQFRQDAFASSPEYDRGVLGNLVSERCHKIESSANVAMLWWLQQVSWREGGLEKFAEQFLADHGHLIGTPSMHRFGMKPGQIYSADQVRTVRAELHRGASAFRLKGEKDFNLHRYPEEMQERALGYPTSYPAQDFLDECEITPAKLAEHLKRRMLDPQTEPTKGLWNLPGLWPALCAMRQAEIEAAAKRIVDTTVTRMVSEELDYALQARTFVLIEGREGIGKSEAARNWCDRHPGQAIYVRLESGADETTLYRSIARVVGTACSYAKKAIEMRARIQDALQPGQLLLVLDEAHFLWPPRRARVDRSPPKRVDWLRTALIDYGVPVALISTPQYFENSCERFEQGGWNANQIRRRLARTKLLPIPEVIPQGDVVAVACRYFPSMSKQIVRKIAAVARGTPGFLTTIKFIRQRVDFLSTRNAGATEEELVTKALQEMGLIAPDDAGSSQPASPVKESLSRPQAQPPLIVPPSREIGAGRLIVREEVSAV
jgi:hypothetical protein